MQRGSLACIQRGAAAAPWQVPSRSLLRSSSRPAGPRLPGRPLLARVSSRLPEYLPDQDSRAGDLVALARRRALQPQPQPSDASGFAEFLRKLRAAWQIFFPEQPKALTPKEEGKQRLRMILVADRCGMSQESLLDMRQSIVRVVADYVDIEAEDLVEVNLSMDPELGTIYSVAVPVKRVKPQARMPLDTDTDPDGIALSWDPNDLDSDPSSQFPYGA